MIFTGLHIFSKSCISTHVLRHVGKSELAGASLSMAFVNVTGFSVISGLALGMDGIMSQAFGDRNFSLMDRTLHQTILILLAAFSPICIMWLNAEPILVFFGQDPKVASLAATYTYFTITTLFLQCDSCCRFSCCCPHAYVPREVDDVFYFPQGYLEQFVIKLMGYFLK